MLVVQMQKSKLKLKTKKGIATLTEKDKRLLGAWLIDAANQCKQIVLTKQETGVLLVQISFK